MRFTKFLAATMAAMTIVSCAEQVEDFGANVQSGDAVLSFKVGTNGGTTYATSAEESEVKSLIAYLKYTNGAGVESFKEVAGTTTGLTTTLADGAYTPGAATLYFVANMPAVTGVANETDLLAKVDNKTIYTNVNGTLTLDPTGMTATRKVEINLQPGEIKSGTPDGGVAFTDGAVKLKRLAARVYAESATNATDIAGYIVDFKGVSAQANLFDYQGAGTGTAPAQYTIAGTGAGQYGGKEAVGYVYPSTGIVTISVTNDKRVAKTATFSPKANQNYKLLITPAKEGTTPDFTISIAVYDETEPDLDVNFGTTTLAISPTAIVPTGFARGGNGELIVENAVGTANAGVKILYADLFNGTAESNLQTLKLVSVRSLSSEYQVSSDGMFAVGDVESDGLQFVALHNYGTDKTYTAIFEAFMNGSDESTAKKYSIKLVVKGMNLPENFTTKVGDIEFMSVGYQGSLDATKILVNEIKRLAGATFADKAIAYLKAHPAETTFSGMTMNSEPLYAQRNTICPAGFILPTKEQMTGLFSMVPPLNISLNDGANTVGATTVESFKSETPPYYTLQQGADKLVVLGQTNFATSTPEVTAGKNVIGRFIFWNGAMSYSPSTLAAKPDNFIRCIKAPQTPLTIN